MPTGKRQQALRLFADVARRLGKKYGVSQMSVSHRCTDELLTRAYRCLCLVVHPDKGGDTADFQELQRAYQVWMHGSRKPGPMPGESTASSSTPCAASTLVAVFTNGDTPARDHVELTAYQSPGAPKPPVFRIRTEAVLLTFNVGQVDNSVWRRFLAHVHASKRGWKVKNWSATLEALVDGALHTHLMLQFFCAGDVASSSFAFEGVKPNARPSYSDYLGEHFSKRNPQVSFDRGFFYVWADKKGTVRLPDGSICVAGDYAPVWTGTKKKYKVMRKWPQSLWEAHKLTHEVWDEYLFLSRQAVVGAKRNLDAVQEHEREHAEDKEMIKVVKRIRGNPELYRPFIKVPEAEQWLAKFGKDALRFPILLILGASFVGKTEWAKSLFQNHLELKIGPLTHFPEKMRTFSRYLHDGVVIDDVRDMEFLAQHQHVLQGKYDERVEFASTPGGQCAYRRWLYAVPFVVTVNYSTSNLDYLRTHDWLSKRDNVVVVELLKPPVEPAVGPAALPAQPSVAPPAEAMQEWSVADVKTLLFSRDLRGLAEACFACDVNGADLAALNESTVATDLRLKPLQARKRMSARAAFLSGRVGDGRTGR